MRKAGYLLGKIKLGSLLNTSRTFHKIDFLGRDDKDKLLVVVAIWAAEQRNVRPQILLRDVIHRNQRLVHRILLIYETTGARLRHPR